MTKYQMFPMYALISNNKIKNKQQKSKPKMVNALEG